MNNSDIRIADGFREAALSTKVYGLCSTTTEDLLQRHFPDGTYVAISDTHLPQPKAFDIFLLEIECVTETTREYFEHIYSRFSHQVIVLPFSVSADAESIGRLMNAFFVDSDIMEYQATPFHQLLKEPVVNRVRELMRQNEQQSQDNWDSVKYLSGSVKNFFNPDKHSPEWWVNRRRLDTTDLVRCVFDKDVVRSNPGLEPPAAWQVWRSDYILFRLESFPLERQFDAQLLDNVFISHRNSDQGLSISGNLHSFLTHLSDFAPFVDKLDLSGGDFRSQLTNVFMQAGVFLCILTPERYEELDWVRRELHAACIMSAAWGTPVPIVVEAGLTLSQLIEMESRDGIHNSRLSRCSIDRFTWDPDPLRWTELTALIERAVVRTRRQWV